MIYLATPYSARPTYGYALAKTVAHALFTQGHFVFSPILHWHPVALDAGLPSDAEYWMAYNINMMSRADDMLVVRASGWFESKGIAAELLWWSKHRDTIPALLTQREIEHGHYNSNSRSNRVWPTYSR